MLNTEIIKKHVQANAPNGAVKLAGAIGCSTSLIWKIIGGADDCKVSVAKGIARECGVTMDELCNQPKPKKSAK